MRLGNSSGTLTPSPPRVSLGSGRAGQLRFSEGPEMATHSSILAWRITWIEEPGGLQSMGLQRVGCNRRDLACTHTSSFSILSYSILRTSIDWFPVVFCPVTMWGKK